MDSRTNLIAMMVLGAMIVALGGTIVTGEIFQQGRPAKMGYVVEGVAVEAGAAAVAKVDIATLIPTADPAKGAEVFKKCAACHSVNNGGANLVGPNLWGTLGEEIGHGKAGYAFSDALSTKGGKWDWQSMDAWLESPRTFAPGTKMTFAGLSNPQDRANILVYLNQNSGSPLPPPTAPAAAAPAAAGAAIAPADGKAAAPGTSPAAATPAAAK